MKAVRFLVWLAMLVSMTTFAGESTSKGKQVDVPAVDVPEKMVVQPTPAEIHEDFPDRSCASCHTPSNQEAESKPLNHFLTAKDCDKCHFSKSWIPLRLYSHLSARYRPNSDPQNCSSCHMSNSEFLAR